MADIKDLIKFSEENNVVKLKEAFNEIIAERVAFALEEKTKDVQVSMTSKKSDEDTDKGDENEKSEKKFPFNKKDEK